MNPEIAFAGYLLAGTASAVTVAFSFPALTFGGGSSVPGVTQSAYDAAHTAEMTYCHTARIGVNCVCFARMSGMIVAYSDAQKRHSAFLDQRTLARNQAVQKC